MVLSKSLAAFLSLLGVLSFSSLGCSQVPSSISGPANTGSLRLMEENINRLYTGLGPLLTSQARIKLQAQQRTWFAVRNRNCKDRDLSCMKEYKRRSDELESLMMTAQVSDSKLNDITPVMVLGRWKATAVHDPQGKGHTDAAAVQASLADGDLPFVGGTVDAAPGKLCVPPNACRNMGWTQTSLAKIDGGDAIASALGLAPSTRVLNGNTGATSSPGLLVVPRSDGNVWVVFGLCGPNASNCRNAIENWAPSDTEAAVWPRL